jgi:hypothetical protein
MTEARAMAAGERWRDAACLALLLAVVATLLWPVVFAGRVPLPDYLGCFAPWAGRDVHTPWNALWYDSLGQYWPWRALLHEGLRHGRLPLWNPCQFSGYPFAGNGQSALFYPFNWLFFGLFSVPTGFRLTAVFHLWLAAAGAFALARELGCRRAAALVSGLTFGLSGFMVTWLTLPTLISSAAWLPWALASLERARRLDSWRAGLAAGLALGMAALAGHPQIFYYAALAAFTIGAARLLPRHWPALAACGLSAGLLAAPALLPVIEMAPHGHRPVLVNRAAYEGFLDRAAPLERLATLAVPGFFGSPARGTMDLFSGRAAQQAADGMYCGIDARGAVSPGDYSEFNVFIGVLPLVLCLFALGLRGAGRVYAAVALAALALAFGLPLNEPLFLHLPGYAAGAGPCRLAVVWSCAAAAAAGLGVEALLAAPRRRELLMAGAAPLVAIAIGWLAARRHYDHFYFAPLLPATQYRHLLGVAAALGVLAAGVALLRWRPRYAALFVAAELLAGGMGFNPSCPAIDLDATIATRWLAARGLPVGPKRGVVLDAPEAWSFTRPPFGLGLPPNLATAAGVRDAGGYDSLLLAGSKDLLFRYADQAPISPLTNGNMLLLGHLKSLPPGTEVAIGGRLPGGEPRTEAEILVDRADEVALRAPAGALVLRDTAYPGWRLLGSDGRQMAWTGAIGGPRQAELGRDDVVRFVYEPTTVRAGLFAALLAVALLMAAVGAGGFRCGTVKDGVHE